MAKRKRTVLKLRVKAFGKNDKKRLRLAQKRLLRGARTVRKGRYPVQEHTKFKKQRGGGGGI